MTDARSAIRDYILREFMPGEPTSALTDDRPLRTSGIVDSMAVLRLVSHLEQTFGIELEAHETGVETFDTVADIAALVEKKRKGGRA